MAIPTNFPKDQDNTYCKIVCGDPGFTFLLENGVKKSVSWSEIAEIRAFKNDLFSIDEVMFSFKLQNGTFVNVSEEQPGFSDLLQAIEMRFPSVIGWEKSVVKPAFKRNETILYSIT